MSPNYGRKHIKPDGKLPRGLRGALFNSIIACTLSPSHTPIITQTHTSIQDISSLYIPQKLVLRFLEVPQGQEAHDGSHIDLIWSECESCCRCPLPERWTMIEQWLSGGFTQETVSGQAGPAANNHLLYKSAGNELLIHRVEQKKGNSFCQLFLHRSTVSDLLLKFVFPAVSMAVNK